LELEIIGSNFKTCLDGIRDWRFNGYFDTTKPPQRPTTNYEYKNNKVIKITNYNSNKTIDFVNEYNNNEKLIKQTNYTTEGIIKDIHEYNEDKN
jgi:hypothetical protein